MVEYARKHQLRPEDITNKYVRSDLFTTYEIESAPPVSFLVQSGFLTFKTRDPELGYLVDYPNKEVRDSMSQLVLLGTYNINAEVNNNIRDGIITGLRKGNFNKVYEQMKITLSSIPYKLYDKKESYYHSIILTLLWACRLDVRAEEMTSLGRSDLVLTYRDDIYIIELKKDKPGVSLEQIKQKGYAEKYRGRNINIVGIEIDPEKRNFKECKIEKLN
jgi:hypothetical protein